MPFDVTFILIGFIALFAFVISDIAKYAPGEKQVLELERKARTHVRSHHYKLPR